MGEFDDRAGEVEAALRDGDPAKVAHALRVAARVEGLDADAGHVLRLVALVGRAAAVVGAAELAEACADEPPGLFARLVGRKPRLDPDRAYRVGFAMLDAGLPEAAVPVLAHALREHPGRIDLATELACALRDTGRHGEACDVLIACAPALDAARRYLLACNALLAGRVELLRRELAAPDSADEAVAAAVAVLRAALARIDRLAGASPLDEHDLRGWHYVLTGGVLLHRSPYGFDEGMTGRWAFVSDSPDVVRACIDRARAVLAAWGSTPTRVLALADPGSRAFADAVARRWGVPVAPFEPGADGVVCAYDLDRVDPAELALLRDRRGLLYVHSACWTSPPPVCPDLLGQLHQFLVAPWDERLVPQPGGGTTRAPASEDPPEAWAGRIAEAEPTTDVLAGDDEATIAAFARVARPATGPRRFWEGGPVRSSRFT